MGCAEHDRALVLEVQESASESTSEIEAVQWVEDEKEVTQEQSESRQTLLYIHVCGAVNVPGVVEVPEGSRVEEALLQAGGFREDAATEYVNLAAMVEDGQQLYFPTKEEAEELTKSGMTSVQEGRAQDSGKVNINTAGTELLCTLPGIGEARAKAIIEYRETYGQFKSIEDIMQVSGIKQNVFEKFCNSIIVN